MTPDQKLAAIAELCRRHLDAPDIDRVLGFGDDLACRVLELAESPADIVARTEPSALVFTATTADRDWRIQKHPHFDSD